MFTVVYSTDTAPTVVSAGGRIVSPNEFAVVEVTPEVEKAFAGGRLHDMYPRITKKGSAPEVWAMKVETDRLNARSKEALPLPTRTIKNDAADDPSGTPTTP